MAVGVGREPRLHYPRIWEDLLTTEQQEGTEMED